MPFTSPGSNITNRITFNSGTLDFGNSRLVDVDNLSLTIEYTLATLFVLGSIKPQAIMRHSQKASLTGKIKSFAPELEMMTLGSSALGAQNTANTLDGQATLQNPVFTAFDSNGKEYQYQFSGAVFKSSKMTARMEDYAEWDFDLEAMDCVILVTP